MGEINIFTNKILDIITTESLDVMFIVLDYYPLDLKNFLSYESS
jgi:hypothetical protein